MPISLFHQFIEDPCLRLTPAFCQNDPFEFGFTDKNVSELGTLYNRKDLGKRLESFSKLHGIISLSATCSSIPMWAHYANNHTGFAVELEIDDTNPENLFINSTSPYLKPKSSDFLFDEVSYEKERGINSNLENLDFEEIRRHYYFTKAKAWQYEKEFRFILPFTWINRIQFIGKKGYQKAKRYLSDDKIRCINPDCNNDEQKKYEVSILQIIVSGGFELLEDLWINSNESDTLFLCRLNSSPDGISSTEKLGNILLGQNCDIEKVVGYIKKDIHRNYYDMINDEVFNIKKCGIDQNEFKIHFNEIQ